MKKWTSIPMITMLQMDPATSRMLRSIPEQPSVQFRHHIKLYFWGFLIIVHIRQGYARVTGSAMPPMRPAKLGKKGNATDIKNVKHPTKTRIPLCSQRGHGLFMRLVYLNSRLSNTCIAYIWKELRQLITTSRLIKASRNLDVSWPWYLCKAFSIPCFVVICSN